MPHTILVTGFGPFPGAPFNPTGPLAQRVTRARRPALADVKIVTHIFPTSYAAVDRELPALIAKHKPDALLMFGLAPRARGLRVETRARNALALLPDAGGASLGRHAIAAGSPTSMKLRTPVRPLLAALPIQCSATNKILQVISRPLWSRKLQTVRPNPKYLPILVRYPASSISLLLRYPQESRIDRPFVALNFLRFLSARSR